MLLLGALGATCHSSFVLVVRSTPTALSDAHMHADTTFADLGGNASVALIDGAPASFINTTFERCEAAAPHALITARGAAAATWLEDVAVPGSDTPGGAFRSEAGAQFYASAALPAGVEVFDAAAGAPSAPEVVPAQPAGTGFATESEAASIRGVRGPAHHESRCPAVTCWWCHGGGRVRRVGV